MTITKNNPNLLFKSKTSKDLFFLFLFTLLITLPFINKAVHVDGIYVLAAKDHILSSPFDPYGFDFDFAQGKTDFSSHYSGSPLLSYYLAFITVIFGGSLITLHLSMIIFSLIAAFSLYFLSRRYLKYPLWPPLLLLATPTLLVTSSNFMQDLPVASFFLLSVTLFLYGMDKNKPSLLILAGLFGGLAILFKYTALLIFPLMTILFLIEKKPFHIIYLLIPAAILLAWLIPFNHLYGNNHLTEILSFYRGDPSQQFTSSSLMQYGARTISQLSHFGGATIFPLFFTLPFLTTRKNKKSFLIALLLPLPFLAFLRFFSSTFISGQYSFGQLALLWLFISSTLFFLSLLIPLIPRSASSVKKPTTFILLWFIAIYLANSLVVGGSARYNTMILAPFLILFCILIETRLQTPQQNKLLTSCLFLTLMLGLCVAIADYQYADTYRDFSQTTPQYKTQSNTVWLIGHQGFAYYLKEKGYEMLPANSNIPKRGDYILKVEIPSPRPLSSELLSRTNLISTHLPKTLSPLRIEHPPSHAGFYTYGSGLLPYSFSSQPIDRFEVYEVVR